MPGPPGPTGVTMLWDVYKRRRAERPASYFLRRSGAIRGRARTMKKASVNTNIS